MRADGAPEAAITASGTHVATLRSRPVAHLANFGLPGRPRRLRQRRGRAHGRPGRVRRAVRVRARTRPRPPCSGRRASPAPLDRARLRSRHAAPGDRRDRARTRRSSRSRAAPSACTSCSAPTPAGPRSCRSSTGSWRPCASTPGRRVASSRMGAWAGPFLIAALLLAAAGVAKVVDPTNTVGALRKLGSRVRRRRSCASAVRSRRSSRSPRSSPARRCSPCSSRCRTCSSPPSCSSRSVAGLPIGSCGCFGKVDTPPSALHVVVEPRRGRRRARRGARRRHGHRRRAGRPAARRRAVPAAGARSGATPRSPRSRWCRSSRAARRPRTERPEGARERASRRPRRRGWLVARPEPAQLPQAQRDGRHRAGGRAHRVRPAARARRTARSATAAARRASAARCAATATPSSAAR